MIEVGGDAFLDSSVALLCHAPLHFVDAVATW